MRQLSALIVTDLRVLFRTGYIWALVVMFAFLLFIAMQAGRLDFSGFAGVVTAIITIDAVLAPVLVIGLMVMLERGEGTFAALAVSPMRRSLYLAARTATVSVISALAMFLLTTIAYDAAWSPVLLAAGLLALAAIASFSAFIVVAPFSTLYGWIVPMIGWVLFMGAPAYGVIFGWEASWFIWHPVMPAMVLLDAVFADVSAGRVALGVLGVVGWLSVGAVLADRTIGWMQARSGGG